jgi:hypothetical protein
MMTSLLMMTSLYPRHRGRRLAIHVYSGASGDVDGGTKPHHDELKRKWLDG